MKRVWDKDNRVWVEVQEGVLLLGTDIVSAADFERIWSEVHTDNEITSKHLKMIFNTLMQRKPLPVFTANADYEKAIRHELAKIYLKYADEYQGRRGQGGRDTNILFTQVPARFQAGLTAVVDGNATPYDRGAHTTRPAVSASAHSVREYHLSLAHGNEGRATSARVSGTALWAYYYSISHAAATYSYHLLTYTYHDDVDDEDYELPLFRNADKFLGQRPL